MLSKWNLFLCYDKLLLRDTWEPTTGTSATLARASSLTVRQSYCRSVPCPVEWWKHRIVGEGRAALYFVFVFLSCKAVLGWKSGHMISFFLQFEMKATGKRRHDTKSSLGENGRAQRQNVPRTAGSSRPLCGGGERGPCARLGLVPAVDSANNICWIWGRGEGRYFLILIEGR